jgi:hypothetical protein
MEISEIEVRAYGEPVSPGVMPFQRFAVRCVYGYWTRTLTDFQKVKNLNQAVFVNSCAM